MYIIIIGNPVDGLRFIGPFETENGAIEWAINSGMDWWIARLEDTHN